MKTIFAAALMLQVDPDRFAHLAGGLDAFAWTFMLVSMGSATALMVWCFARILRTRKHFDPDGTGPAEPPVSGRLEQEGRKPAR